MQRYKGLGEMTAPQLWETTMDPARRTLVQVKLEDIAATEEIFTTLMGEDVEAAASSSKRTRWTSRTSTSNRPSLVGLRKYWPNLRNYFP